MKIEIGESLAGSYLRHVERCWLVQANWKASEHWERSQTDAELETLFQGMKRRFDRTGIVFKQTKDAAQLLKQGELDIVGVDLKGDVHAMEVAFHEAGLRYYGGNVNRVLKKMLRALLILQAYLPPQTTRHISFLSPKVNSADQQSLEKTFAALRKEYPETEWSLIINGGFAEQIVKPTLEKASDVADSAELFARSAKLLELAGYRLDSPVPAPNEPPASSLPPNGEGKIQPLVQGLMRTLLVDYPALLSDPEKRDLMDNEHCKNRLGLRLGNFALIRKEVTGKKGDDGRNRYYKDLYGGFYVCFQWGKNHHRANAKSLLEFVERLAHNKDGQLGADALERHAQAFRDYLADTSLSHAGDQNSPR